MKIVGVMGSPRTNGNSDTIARQILLEAEKLGADTETFVLNNLSYKGCQACMGCKIGSDKCVIRDDLAAVLAAVASADVLIMASPIYFGQVTGQLKTFIDRTYSFLTPDYLKDPMHASRLAPGKKCVFILTQGNPDETMFADVAGNFERFLTWYGYDVSVIRGLGMRDKEDAANDKNLLAKASETARQLVAG